MLAHYSRHKSAVDTVKGWLYAKHDMPAMQLWGYVGLGAQCAETFSLDCVDCRAGLRSASRLQDYDPHPMSCRRT